MGKKSRDDGSGGTFLRVEKEKIRRIRDKFTFLKSVKSDAAVVNAALDMLLVSVGFRLIYEGQEESIQEV